MAFEVSQCQERVIVQHVFADRHILEPLAAFDRQQRVPVLVGDVDGGKGPAVVGDGLSVLLSRVAVAFIEGVGLDDGRVLIELLREEFLYPGARDDVRAVFFSGVELDRQFAGQSVRDFIVDLQKAFRRKVSREIDDRSAAGAFFDRDMAFAAAPGFLAIAGHRITS